jgi:cobalt/nickel transport system permease protein
MTGMSFTLALPWAVHISDGVLQTPWLVGGFALAGLLALVAAYRIRDEEIPRIALLSAAFFVAALMHLRLGPTSVHLLLNGLVGVVLGRRAPLAILIGLGLQAALLGHGGFYTIGINACVLTLPALLVGGLCLALLRRAPNAARSSALGWLIGFALGAISVLMTLILQAAVLLWGGAEDWRQIVAVVFIAHLPIVLVEGIVVGFTVSFLARVKPEMIGLSGSTLDKWQPATRDPSADDADRIAAEPTGTNTSQLRVSSVRQAPGMSPPPLLLLAALTVMFAATPAHAHRLDAAYKVLPDRRVQIESWFDLGGLPKGGTVQVFRPGDRLLAEGQLDDNGQFTFRFTEVEPLRVIVSAGGGHRKAFVIEREELERTVGETSPRNPPPVSEGFTRVRDDDEAWRERFKDALLGVSFLLALAAFVLSWRNGQRLKAMRQRETALPQPPTDHAER